MIKLIQNIDVYAPGHLGKKDVLIVHDKIVKIADAGSLSIPSYFPESEQIDGTNLILTPGFIDCHLVSLFLLFLDMFRKEYLLDGTEEEEKA